MAKQIGEILVEIGAISKSQVEKGVKEGKKTGTLLGQVLLRLDWITEEQLLEALSLQSGVKVFDAHRTGLDPTLTALIPQGLARERGIFPINVEDGVLKIATANPFDLLTKDAVARKAGLQVEAYLAPQSWINNLIDLHYNAAQAIDREIEKISQQEFEGGGAGEGQVIRLARRPFSRLFGRCAHALSCRVLPPIASKHERERGSHKS